MTVVREIDAVAAHEIFGLVTGAPVVPAGRPPTQRGAKRTTGTRSAKPLAEGTKKAKRKSSSPGIVRDLSLKPSGKKSLKQFIDEKEPKTHQQKQAVIVYWLREFGGLAADITSDHVNTCYLEAGWPRPADLDNSLQVTAKTKGWLDTSSMADIKLTTRGEDEVTHELPVQS